MLPCHNNQAMALKEGTKRKCNHCTLRATIVNLRRQTPNNSVKLKEDFKKWIPCETKALAFTVAIKAAYDVL